MKSPTQGRPRKIVRRTRGSRHGTITRLMSPGDLGQLLKPLVFLDLFDMEKLIAVIGATGQQGGAVVHALQARGEFKVRALSRDPEKHRDLADEVVTADLNRAKASRRIVGLGSPS